MAGSTEQSRAEKIQALLKTVSSPEFQKRQNQLDHAEAQRRVPSEDPEALAQFDKDMLADEARRFKEMDKLIREKYGGIHPLYGSRTVGAGFDAARTLPLHAYPYRRPDTTEGSAHRDYDYAHFLTRTSSGRHPSGVPQSEVDTLERYSHPLKDLSEEDLDSIERHRLEAIKAQLEQNGYKLPGAALYPGTKYPLTGPPLELGSGHPLLQPESSYKLLPAAPELRAGELLQDANWLTMREKEREEENAAKKREEDMTRLRLSYGCDPELVNKGNALGIRDPIAPPMYTSGHQYGYQVAQSATESSVGSPKQYRTSESGSILNQTRFFAGREFKHVDPTAVGSRHYLSPLRPFANDAASCAEMRPAPSAFTQG